MRLNLAAKEYFVSIGNETVTFSNVTISKGVSQICLGIRLQAIRLNHLLFMKNALFSIEICDFLIIAFEHKHFLPLYGIFP